MRFSVDPAVFSHLPGMRLAIAVATGIDNAAEYPQVKAKWAEAWADARSAAAYGNSQSHPRVQPWREALQALGVSGKKFPSSIEALLRRALKGGHPFSINPLVDFYNAVSLRHVVPAGGFDLAQLADELMLRFSRTGDSFQALDDPEPELLPAGELSYATGETILTRHFVWRQSRTALITSDTTNVFLVSEILGQPGPDLAEDVLSDLVDGLQRHFAVQARAFIVDTARPAIEW